MRRGGYDRMAKRKNILEEIAELSSAVAQMADEHKEAEHSKYEAELILLARAIELAKPALHAIAPLKLDGKELSTDSERILCLSEEGELIEILRSYYSEPDLSLGENVRRYSDNKPTSITLDMAVRTYSADGCVNTLLDGIKSASRDLPQKIKSAKVAEQRAKSRTREIENLLEARASETLGLLPPKE